TAGAALSSHPGIDYVTFTGSPVTGTAIQQAAAANNRGVTMELGGKSPQILFADADVEKALPVLVNAIIQNGGQTCSAGSRILIERPLYNEVAAALGERFSKLIA
ncbi:aldehyde dehydrogenase family protein, partial [Escherichia coli]|nr:aldehyde dehydrogenase family protein [Escherichia coli]